MTKDSSGQTTAVQVALRIRPLTERDRTQPRFANLAHDDVLKIHDSTVQVVPQNKLFTFDHVFGTNSTQEEIFSALGENLVRKFVEGYNITILAYGQTSSGKTYTMGTAADGQHNTSDEGIVPRSMALLFDLLNHNDTPRPISPTSSLSSSTSASNKSNSRLMRPKSKIGHRSSHIPQVPPINKTKFTVKVSFIEIYNEDLHDLLNSAPPEELPPITIREDTKGRIYWTGVKEVVVHSTDDVLFYLEQGTQNRATGSTDMNAKSSRSHAIFSVSLTQEKWIPSTTTTTKRPSSSMSTRSSITPNTNRLFNTTQEEGECLITTSKFHFVDLAGSERLKRTAAEGDRRKEGININAGLLALGNVISALGDPSKKTKVHVPYRDSKLTRLLQDSLGGSATTLMIACASPVEYNLSETLNTLQYANRARSIKNRSEKNQVEEWMTTENIELLRSLIGKLKNELNYLKSNRSPSSSLEKESDEEEEDEVYHDQRMLISDLQRQVEELDVEASVTRERNRIVEKELERVRRLETMMNNKKDVDFQHLVEPVIEEYEKSVSTLESQLALARAALNHSDIGHEEQEAKLAQLENLIRTQEQTINSLQLRLSKILEREQSNESYIYELETKLMKSANETTKDQEMLNELKNKIMKFKETDENTEQYIHSLEQRLANGDAERIRLTKSVEDLETKLEAKERTNLELLKRLSKTDHTENNTEKLILKELNQANAKNLELENQCNSLQQKLDLFEKQNMTVTPSPSIEINPLLTEDPIISASSSSSPSPPPTIKYRKNLASETETPASVAALSLVQAESKIKQETDRANKLQLDLERLQYDHQDTLKELEEVLQRYHETLEQLEFLEHDSSSITAHTEDELPSSRPKSLDLSKEIAQAKETEFEQDKKTYELKILSLEQQQISIQDEYAIQIQKLEHDLGMANKLIYRLEQADSDQKQALVTEAEKNLEQERQLTKQWKSAHTELKQDVEKLTLDLDQKETYLLQLKEKLEQSSLTQTELQLSLEEANQQSTASQKRLAETLASFTVLKISHEKLLEDSESKEGLLNELRQKLDNATLVNESLQERLKEMEHMNSSHVSEFNSTSNDLKEKISVLETNLELARQMHDETLVSMTQNTNDHDAILQRLNTQIEQLKNTSESDTKRLKETEAELDELNQHIIDLTKQHETEIDALEQENEKLNHSLDDLCDTHLQLEEATIQLTTLQQTLIDLQTSHATERDQLISKHKLEIESIQLVKDQLESSLKKLEQIRSDQDQSIQALQFKLSNLEATNQTQTSTLDQLSLENTSLKKIKDESMRSMDLKHADITQELSQLHQDYATQIQQLNESHQASKSGYEQRMATQAQTTQDLETKLDQVKTEFEQLELVHAGVLQKMVSLESELSSAKAELVTLVQRHQVHLKEVQSQHADALVVMTTSHDAHIDHIRREHEANLKERFEELQSLNEKDETIQEQRQAIEGHVLRINQLEKEVNQMTEENKEFSGLATELEGEMNRMTSEIERLGEELDESEEQLNVYQDQMNEIKLILGVENDDEDMMITNKIKELVERSTTTTTTQGQGDQSSVEKDGSGAKQGTHQQLAEAEEAVKLLERQLIEATDQNRSLSEDLENYQNQMKDMVPREEFDQIVQEEKQKLDKADKTIKKLEKQLDELLRKKSSFMCF